MVSIVAKTAIAAGTIFSCTAFAGAQQPSSIDQYIKAHGGCAVATNWQREFFRPGYTPFGKALVEWQNSDFDALRYWSDQCMDPWARSDPQRRALVLKEANDKISSFKRSQADLVARTDRLREQQKAAQTRSANIEELEAQLQEARQKAETAVSAFDVLAGSYLEQATNINQLEEMLRRGDEIKSDGDATMSAVYNARRIIYELSKSGKEAQDVLASGKYQALAAKLVQLRKTIAAMKTCEPVLRQLGFDEKATRTQVLLGEGDRDPYLFEYICPRADADVTISTPGIFSKFYTINTSASTLYFEFAERSKSEQTSRLLLRRVKTEHHDLSAKAEWEAANLANGASVFLLMR